MNKISKFFKRKELKYLNNPRISFHSIELKPKWTFSDLLAIFDTKRVRPDLINEKVEMVLMHQPKSKWELELYLNQPIFSNISPRKSVIYGWFNNIMEYQHFAQLEFARRYPNHEYSIRFRKAFRFSKKQVTDYINGKKQFNIAIIGGRTIFFRN